LCSQNSGGGIIGNGAVRAILSNNLDIADRVFVNGGG
ncbi:MAG: hypothetical protein QOF64_2397, partial [Candidatus Binatota bacterium]|nr:hypothetical protein [Candidatus Binatota bacterium]